MLTLCSHSKLAELLDTLNHHVLSWFIVIMQHKGPDGFQHFGIVQNLELCQHQPEVGLQVALLLPRVEIVAVASHFVREVQEDLLCLMLIMFLKDRMKVE
jgi:hypothetical protein